MNARGLGSELKDSIPVAELSASGPFESHDLLRKGYVGELGLCLARSHEALLVDSLQGALPGRL